jgi:hypothetical protein
MKTTDIFPRISSKTLNESLAKTFGKTLNLESFTLEQLQDARNKLRTQISQIRSDSSFNETIENENHTKTQWMLDVLNKAISEREEYVVYEKSKDDDSDSSIDDQVRDLVGRFDDNMTQMRVYGDPDVDRAIAYLKQGDAEAAVEVIVDTYGTQDGGEFIHMSDYAKDLLDDFEVIIDSNSEQDDEGGETDDGYALASAGHGSDEDYESIQHEEDRSGQDNYDKILDAIAALYGDDIWDNDSMQDLANDLMQAGPSDKELDFIIANGKLPRRLADTEFTDNDSVKFGEGRDLDDESFGIYDSYNFDENQSTKEFGESMNTQVNENELNKASAVVSAKGMVDKVSRWIEELAGMENDTLLQLGDSIRDEMGQEAAKTFLSAVAPAIQSALDTLKSARETMSTGVRALTGEVQPAEMLGGTDDAGDDFAEPAEPDAMNPEMSADDEAIDDFAAAEPAAGGLDTAGRAQRESIQRSSRLMKVLAG